jgi:hypothetical protein
VSTLWWQMLLCLYTVTFMIEHVVLNKPFRNAILTSKFNANSRLKQRRNIRRWINDIDSIPSWTNIQRDFNVENFGVSTLTQPDIDCGEAPIRMTDFLLGNLVTLTLKRQFKFIARNFDQTILCITISSIMTSASFQLPFYNLNPE